MPPDASDLHSLVAELVRRVTALEQHRTIDARNRTLSQRRIEKALANIIDPELESSLTFKVNGLYDILAQFRGVFRFLKWSAGVVAFAAVVLGLVNTAHALWP